ncbi:MAG: hypothetical protein EBY17_31495, partial [Acidobacteriia bacterium]|nr:hypothetical protein [Terriglobia bacterium]
MAWMKVVALLLWSHITQRPFRTGLTIVGVALGVAASVAVRTANMEVLHSFEQAVLTVAGPTTLEVSGGDFGLDEQLIAKVRDVPGLASASPVLVQTAVRLDAGTTGAALQVMGLDLLAEFDSRGFRVAQEENDNPLADMLKADSVYLGRKLAAEWHLTTGSTIQLQAGPRQVQARVAGVIQDRSDRVSS